MKKLFILLLSGIPVLLPAQHRLETHLNLPRPGDEIIKQQVEYKDPGRAGENVLWDFGQLQSINDEYTLSYSEPFVVDDSMYILGMDTILLEDLADESFLIGTEHHTMYYYRLTDNRWWTLGHENPVTLLQYTQPLLAGFYPMMYRDSCSHAYQSKGLYSSTVPFTSDGETHIRADACGMMILPSGDTLRNVLRTQTIQTIRQVFRGNDSVTVEHHSLIKNCKWYSQGYRYPIFETIRSFIIQNETETVNFETAFFFPPQEHYYLETDSKNQTILEAQNQGNQPYNPLADVRFNAFPNPVNALLYVEIFLPIEAKIKIQVRSVVNKSVYINENKGKFPAGSHSFQLNTNLLPPGYYLLNIWADNYPFSETILKF